MTYEILFRLADANPNPKFLIRLWHTWRDKVSEKYVQESGAETTNPQKFMEELYRYHFYSEKARKAYRALEKENPNFNYSEYSSYTCSPAEILADILSNNPPQ